MPSAKMHADVSLEVIVAVRWEHPVVTTADVNRVSVESMGFAVEPCGILRVLPKPFLIARAIAIAPMV